MDGIKAENLNNRPSQKLLELFNEILNDQQR